jgi:phage gp36-like protein
MPVPYATIAQFKDAVDERLLEELGIDAEADGVVDANNTIVMASLARASHEIESFTLRGGMYTTEDLDLLQSQANWLLIGITCDLAIGILMARRGGQFSDAIRDRLDKANSMLAGLARGERVFPLADTISASRPKVSIMSQQQRGALGMVADSEFFPRRRTGAV